MADGSVFVSHGWSKSYRRCVGTAPDSDGYIGVTDGKGLELMGKLSGVTGVIIGILGTLAVIAVIGLIVVYTGAYNVAATEDHTPFGRWALDTTMHNSVSSRAGGIAAPARFTSAMISAGAGEYKEYCQHCHGGPGVTRAEWATGMLPMPPELHHAASEWTPSQVFWIVKHGIRMSGMPAFGDTESDQAIWNIAAFVEQLPAMTPEQYKSFGGSGGHSH